MGATAPDQVRLQLADLAPEQRERFFDFLVAKRVVFDRNDEEGKWQATVHLLEENGDICPSVEVHEEERRMGDLAAQSRYPAFWSMLPVRPPWPAHAFSRADFYAFAEWVYEDRRAEAANGRNKLSKDYGKSHSHWPFRQSFPSAVVAVGSQRFSTAEGVAQGCWEIAYSVDELRAQQDWSANLFGLFLEETYDSEDLLFVLRLRKIVKDLFQKHEQEFASDPAPMRRLRRLEGMRLAITQLSAPEVLKNRIQEKVDAADQVASYGAAAGVGASGTRLLRHRDAMRTSEALLREASELVSMDHFLSLAVQQFHSLRGHVKGLPAPLKKADYRSCYHSLYDEAKVRQRRSSMRRKQAEEAYRLDMTPWQKPKLRSSPTTPITPIMSPSQKKQKTDRKGESPWVPAGAHTDPGVGQKVLDEFPGFEKAKYSFIIFQPGELGLSLNLPSGEVKGVTDGGPADQAGVRVKWMLSRLDGAAYTSALFKAKAAGEKPFEAVFRVSAGSKLPPPPPTLLPDSTLALQKGDTEKKSGFALTVRVTNVESAKLALGSYRSVVNHLCEDIRSAVASECGDDISAEHIMVAFSTRPFAAEVMVLPPKGVATSVVQAVVAASTSFGFAVAAAIAHTAGIEAVLTGLVVSSCITSPHAMTAKCWNNAMMCVGNEHAGDLA